MEYKLYLHDKGNSISKENKNCSPKKVLMFFSD